MEEMEKITLYDENGKACEYELIDLFEHNGNVYGGFAPLLGEESDGTEEELEIVMLKVIVQDFLQIFLMLYSALGLLFYSIFKFNKTIYITFCFFK